MNNMIRVNDAFLVSEGADYVLVSDRLLRINSGVAHVVKPYAVAEARASGAVAVALASGALAENADDFAELATSDGYTLKASAGGTYYAGCRGPFTSKQALAHWDREDDRACLFTFAILMFEAAKEEA